MKYPFEYKEVEKNLAEVGVLPYASKGMRFVKFIYIKVSRRFLRVGGRVIQIFLAINLLSIKVPN